MSRIWRNLRPEDIYLSDSLSVLRSGARWLTLLSLGWALARWGRMRPRSLLDNQPLGRLLSCGLVPLERLPQLIADGHLRALAVSASSYTTSEHVTFCQAQDQLQPWVRNQRKAAAAQITHAHLLASSAIPFIFPATPLPLDGATEYFGDGSMRQTAPLAPAIHLGAERILVVGAGRRTEPPARPPPEGASYPSLAHIAGHTLSSIFLDALSLDVERAERINQTLALIPPADRERSRLRPLQLLVISPSERIDAIAARHVGQLPLPMRTLLGALGVRQDASDPRGAALASYLLFERSFTRELMAPGPARRWRGAAISSSSWLAAPAGRQLTPAANRPGAAKARNNSPYVRLHGKAIAAPQPPSPSRMSGSPRKPPSMTARKLFVTTALPYANGNFHIGHIMEYIQADTWRVRSECRATRSTSWVPMTPTARPS